MTEDEWTLRFPEVNSGIPFEIVPTEMTFRQERRKFDHARLTFSWEVGEEMKPHTRYQGGELRSQQPVDICLNGEPVQTMLFRPDNVDYADSHTYVELVDLQKSLSSGVVDKQWDQVKLQEAYRYAFERRKDDELLTDIKFTIPEYLETTLVSGNALEDGITNDDFEESSAATQERLNQIQKIEQSDTYQMVKGRYAVDFDKVSPAEAIWKLNKKYRLMSWADSDGTLWVGTPETSLNYHIAAQDDNRVWHFSDVSISHPREPVQNVVVEGRWVDEPGHGTVDDIISWFNPGDEKGFGDVRATGIAGRTDIDYGLSFTVKNTGAKRDALDTVARLTLREEMKKQNSGSVNIDPEVSGDYTDVREVSLGDFIHLVPDDEFLKYGDIDYLTEGAEQLLEFGTIGNTPDEALRDAHGNFVHNEVYVINGIQHDLSERGGWTVSLDVSLYPDDPIESFIRYFNPQSGNYMTEDEVYDGNAWFGAEDDTY